MLLSTVLLVRLWGCTSIATLSDRRGAGTDRDRGSVTYIVTRAQPEHARRLKSRSFCGTRPDGGLHRRRSSATPATRERATDTADFALFRPWRSERQRARNQTFIPYSLYTAFSKLLCGNNGPPTVIYLCVPTTCDLPDAVLHGAPPLRGSRAAPHHTLSTRLLVSGTRGSRAARSRAARAPQRSQHRHSTGTAQLYRASSSCPRLVSRVEGPPAGHPTSRPAPRTAGWRPFHRLGAAAALLLRRPRRM